MTSLPTELARELSRVQASALLAERIDQTLAAADVAARDPSDVEVLRRLIAAARTDASFITVLLGQTSIGASDSLPVSQGPGVSASKHSGVLIIGPGGVVS